MNPLPALFVPLLLLVSWLDGWLGVYLDPEREEAVVTEVIPGSPADTAGLKVGDVLLAVDDTATPTREAFVASIRKHDAGARVRIKLRRDGTESTVTVRLGKREAEGVGGGEPPARPPVGEKPAAPPRPAVEVAPIEPAPPAKVRGTPYLGLAVRGDDDGIVIDRVVAGGPAASSDLAAGERITRIGDHAVATLADLDRALAERAPGDTIAIEVRGPRGVRSVTIALGVRPGEAPSAAARPGRRRDAHAAPAEPPRPGRAEVADLEREIEALRAELRQLRRELQELREAAREPGRE